MKYKYLKGSERDFDGAPEWALIKTRVGACELWIEGFGFGYKSQLIGYDAVSEAGKIPGVGAVIAERQPITEPSWDGVGLPPVGCEFEYQDHHGEFTRAIMDYCGRDFAIVNYSDRGDSWLRLAGLKFRTIRSEADKKREEAIIALARVSPDVAQFKYGEKMSNGDLVGSAWYDLYDAIAAGKIPGVKLED